MLLHAQAHSTLKQRLVKCRAELKISILKYTKHQFGQAFWFHYFITIGGSFDSFEMVEIAMGWLFDRTRAPMSNGISFVFLVALHWQNRDQNSPP